MPPLLQGLTAFFITIVFIMLLSGLAHPLGLIDRPSVRKRHKGDTPLVGGIAIFCALIITSAVWSDADRTLITINGYEAHSIFMISGFLLVLTGAIDDRFRLGVFMRSITEIAVAISVIELLGIRLSHLGDFLAVGPITMPENLSYIFSILAIFGIINAFNMLDGLDGLLASLVIVTIVMFHLFINITPGFFNITIGASLLAFLLSNLSLIPVIPKTFLGDSGSKLLGFIVVSLLLAAASAQVGESKIIQPVTALFIVALPLFDMVLVTLKRIISKSSPFVADRSHIHHLLQDLGFSDRRSLILILGTHLSITFIGFILHRAGAPEYYQFFIFLCCFGLYGISVSQLRRVTTRCQVQYPRSR